jgi:hypothetical protein
MNISGSTEPMAKRSSSSNFSNVIPGDIVCGSKSWSLFCSLDQNHGPFILITR